MIFDDHLGYAGKEGPVNPLGFGVVFVSYAASAHGVSETLSGVVNPSTDKRAAVGCRVGAEVMTDLPLVDLVFTWTEDSTCLPTLTRTGRADESLKLAEQAVKFATGRAANLLEGRARTAKTAILQKTGRWPEKP